MSTSDMSMSDSRAAGRAAATKSAKRTALILGVVAVVWYFGFMAMRLL